MIQEFLLYVEKIICFLLLKKERHPLLVRLFSRFYYYLKGRLYRDGDKGLQPTGLLPMELQQPELG